MRFAALLLIVISFVEMAFHSSSAHAVPLSDPQANLALIGSPSQGEASPVQNESEPTAQGFHVCHLGHCPVTITNGDVSLVSPSLGEVLVLGYFEPHLSPDCDDFFKPPRLAS